MTKHQLVGKPIQFTSGGRRAGTFYGIVRKVTLTRATRKRPAEIKTLIVQRPGGENVVNGKSYSARCGGERIRITLDQVQAVSWFGKLRPLDEWLA